MGRRVKGQRVNGVNGVNGEGYSLFQSLPVPRDAGLCLRYGEDVSGLLEGKLAGSEADQGVGVEVEVVERSRAAGEME